MKTEAKTYGIHNWFAERFSKPLDRLWLGGVVAVNALVWAAFGMKYIGLALIAYGFIFVLVLRRRIHVAYPAEADAEYRIGYEFNWPNFAQEQGQKFILRYGLLAFFACLLAGGIVFLSVDYVTVKLATVSSGLVWLTCNGFSITRHRALFTHCCGRGTLTVRSEKRIQKMLGARHHGAFAPIRLTIATIAFAVAWIGLLTAYITGLLGGGHFFGIQPTGISALLNATGVTFVPALLHLIFFETSTTVLRGWGDES